MNKLRKKVFWTIFGIMTLGSLIAVITFNVQSYFNTQAVLKKAVDYRMDPLFLMQSFSESAYIDFVIKRYFINLIGSLIIFIMFDVVLFFVSKLITNWIVLPAEESFKKQSLFIADASHELKTPLSVIIASTDALMEDPNKIKWIKNIKEESNRMNHLISKLLRLASMKSLDKGNFEKVNLSKLVQLAALTYEGKAIEKGIRINLSLEEDLFHCVIKEDIKELIEILLDNAFEHSNSNSELKITLYKNNKSIYLLVQNQGENIPKGYEEKIFERFYRIDKSRNTDKNKYGLGLAIAKSICLHHNAKISAKSVDNITTFTVVFD